MGSLASMKRRGEGVNGLLAEGCSGASRPLNFRRSDRRGSVEPVTTPERDFRDPSPIRRLNHSLSRLTITWREFGERGLTHCGYKKESRGNLGSTEGGHG